VDSGAADSAAAAVLAAVVFDADACRDLG
jgi:hypothetical protein